MRTKRALAGVAYHWPTVANSALATILRTAIEHGRDHGRYVGGRVSQRLAGSSNGPAIYTRRHS
jgi:hypothetical protein